METEVDGIGHKGSESGEDEKNSQIECKELDQFGGHGGGVEPVQRVDCRLTDSLSVSM